MGRGSLWVFVIEAQSGARKTDHLLPLEEGPWEVPFLVFGGPFTVFEATHSVFEKAHRCRFWNRPLLGGHAAPQTLLLT